MHLSSLNPIPSDPCFFKVSIGPVLLLVQQAFKSIFYKALLFFSVLWAWALWSTFNPTLEVQFYPLFSLLCCVHFFLSRHSSTNFAMCKPTATNPGNKGWWLAGGRSAISGDVPPAGLRAFFFRRFDLVFFDDILVFSKDLPTRAILRCWLSGLNCLLVTALGS